MGIERTEWDWGEPEMRRAGGNQNILRMALRQETWTVKLNNITEHCTLYIHCTVMWRVEVQSSRNTVLRAEKRETLLFYIYWTMGLSSQNRKGSNFALINLWWQGLLTRWEKVPKVLPSSFYLEKMALFYLIKKNELVYNLLQMFFSVVKAFLLIILQHCLKGLSGEI